MGRNFTHIILEGADRVGKSSLIKPLLKATKYQYVVYDRGDLSNFVYAKKFNRSFVINQFREPYLYILLLEKKETLRKRLAEENSDLILAEDQKLFILAAKTLKPYLRIVKVQSYLYKTTQEKIDAVVRVINREVESDKDDLLSDYNQAYKEACDRLNIPFFSKDGQPYIYGRKMCSDIWYYSGEFETYKEDVGFPLNLLYCSRYSRNRLNERNDFSTFKSRAVDFAYPINTKLSHRQEIIDYFEAMTKHDLSVLTSNPTESNEILFSSGKIFGDDFIRRMAASKATIYTSRDCGNLDYVTSRAYEGILAGQLVFFDEETDPHREFIRSFGLTESEIDLLMVTPKTLAAKYSYLMTHEKTCEMIRFSLKQGLIEKFERLPKLIERWAEKYRT